MMKQGNQFYLQLQIYDNENNALDMKSVNKIQFTIDSLIKTYDGENKEVSFNENDSSFNIFLTEEETFNFKNHINVEARVLFKNDTILGTLIENTYVSDCLKKVKMDVETKNN